MTNLEKSYSNLEYQKVNKEILNWISNKEKILNVISVPYNSSSIFFNIIMKCAKNGKNILYITNEAKNKVNIIKFIKKYTSFKKYCYVTDENQNFTSLVVTDYNVAAKITKKFELVIYDDISSYSNYKKVEILDLISKCCDKKNKVIIYSMQKIIKGQKKIYIPGSKNKNPITEPRIILTKVNTYKEIPYGAYEYLNWSMQLNRRVIIYVSSEDIVKNIYNYLFYIKRELTNNLFYYIKKDQNKESLQNFNHLKKSILVTNDCEDNIVYNYKNIDIMTCFSDNEFFDYKKLMFFCGRAKRGENKNLSEVVFLCNKENECIEKVKDATRAFNKEAWEKGLLNI